MLSDAQLYAILILFLIAIVVVIFVSNSYTPDQGFGTWRVDISRCEANTKKCADGGTRVIVSECLPNPLTKRGCINPVTGKQTFETRVESQPCDVLCRSSIWELQSVSDCQVSDVNLGQNIGTQTFTYECVPNDPTGSNYCTTQDFIPWSAGTMPAVTSYSVGETIEVENSCDLPPPSPTGNWVLVNWNAAKDLPRDVYFPYSGYHTEAPLNQNFVPMSNCVAFQGGAPGLNVLKEGSGNDVVACLYQDQILIPSNQMYVPECGSYLGVPSNQRYCRYFPDPSPLPGVISELTRSFGILRINGFPVTAVNTPRDGFASNPLTTTEQIDTTQALNPVNLATFVPLKRGCTSEEVTFNTSVLLYIALRSSPRYVAEAVIFEAQIGVLIDTGFIGWLSVDSENVATWVQMEYQVDGPGLRSDDVPIFSVTLFGYDMNTKQSRITIMDTNNQPVYVKQILDGNVTPNLLPILSGSLNFYLQDDPRVLDRSTSQCNLLLSI